VRTGDNDIVKKNIFKTPQKMKIYAIMNCNEKGLILKIFIIICEVYLQNG